MHVYPASISDWFIRYHYQCKQRNEPIRTRSNKRATSAKRGKARAMIGFGFGCDWLIKQHVCSDWLKKTAHVCSDWLERVAQVFFLNKIDLSITDCFERCLTFCRSLLQENFDNQNNVCEGESLIDKSTLLIIFH